MMLRNLGQWRAYAKEAWNGSFRVAKFLCLLHVTSNYLCTPTIGVGPSMLPTINITGDIVLCEKLSLRFGKVRPGDIVLVQSPNKPRKTLIKRVVGMEGDQVTYVVDPRNGDRYETTVVPKGHVWIEGDNSYASRDSREFGAIPYGLVKAKAFCRVWPLKDFGALADKSK